MPYFSRRSLDNLATADPDLQRLFKEVIKFFDCAIIEGYRTLERQKELYDAGKSLKLRGKHNMKPSLAVDVAPYPIEWENTERFRYFGGFVMGIAKMMNIPLRWGGDWGGTNMLSNNNFSDLVHYELKEEPRCLVKKR